MLARVFTAALHGLQPIKIEVEVNGTRGIPGLTLIGLPSKAVNEARERISSALANCGLKIRSKRTIINLAPADLHKTATSFDLAMAVGLLKMYGDVQLSTDDTLFLGELSLDGSIKPVKGALALASAAKSMGFKKVILPKANRHEVSIISNITLYEVSHLSEILAWARLGRALPIISPTPFQPHGTPTQPWLGIIGQITAKRALSIAMAGWHHALLTGSPGCGKTELAQGCAALLPPLTETECLEVTKLHSIAGLTTQLQTQRPIRQPHHSITQTALLGGGHHLQPGELSLAHRGILILDELPEFRSQCLAALRPPLDRGMIHITTTQGSVEYPAQVCVIATANPCPCGQVGSAHHVCRCSAQAKKNYGQRLSGALKDRFDLQVWVDDIQAHELEQPQPEPNYIELKLQIEHAHWLQRQRWKSLPHTYNSQASWQQLCELGQFAADAITTLHQVHDRYQLSMRAVLKIARVSRTIADLAREKTVSKTHVTEAALYRTPTDLIA